MSYFNRLVVRFLKGSTETDVSSTEPLPVQLPPADYRLQEELLSEILVELKKANIHLSAITELGEL